jgi:hypothetical protein
VDRALDEDAPMIALPNPFVNSAASDAVADTVAVSSAPLPPAATVPISSGGGPQEAPAVVPHAAAGLLDEWALKWSDEILYLTLKQMDKPETRDLPAIPDEQAFLYAIDEPPLFPRTASH